MSYTINTALVIAIGRVLVAQSEMASSVWQCVASCSLSIAEKISEGVYNMTSGRVQPVQGWVHHRNNCTLVFNEQSHIISMLAQSNFDVDDQWIDWMAFHESHMKSLDNTMDLRLKIHDNTILQFKFSRLSY